MATRSVLIAPTFSTVVIPAITASAGRVRCSNSTSISIWVPSRSPHLAFAAAQNASCVLLKTPSARACASAAAPANAPGLTSRISR